MRPIVILALSLPAFATTYYVSNSGSDSNNGTSIGTPWQTIAKVNAQILNPSDTVLFQAGGTWREQLYASYSGTGAALVTYSSYGAGTLPIISGANVLTGFTQVGSTHVWTKTVATQPKVLIFNGTSGVQQSSSSTVTSIYTWSYSGTTLSVYSVSGDPSTTYSPLEAGQRDYGIIADPASYVLINGLQTQYTNNSGIAFFGGGSNWTVQNSASIANYYFGIVGNSETTGNSNITIQNNTTAWNGSCGIVGSSVGNNWLIQYNTSYNNAWGGNWTVDTIFNAAGNIRMFGGGTMSNCIIQSNRSYNGGLGPTGMWNTQGANQSPPDLEDGGGVMFDTMGTGCIMRWNVTWNNEVAGLRCVVDIGSLVYGNISYGNVQVIELTNYSGMGIDLDFGISGTQVYNNTLYGNQIGVLAEGNVAASKTIVNLLFQNNLSVGNLQVDLYAAVGGNNDGTNGSGNIYTYNGFGAASSNFLLWTAGTYYSTYSSWEGASGNCGTTGCSHSLQSNPVFVNAANGDFHLIAGSPALTASSTGGYIGALGTIPPVGLAGPISIAGPMVIQ